MRKYLNATNVPLSVAVFLANDTYDHEENVVSATKLIKSVRQLILGGRVPQEKSLVDINGLFKSRMGTALHDSIERAWINNYSTAMEALGYPKGVISKVRINPAPDSTEADTIPVYLEKRSYKTVNGQKVSGKFDFVAEGRVEDFKSTSVYMFTKGTKDEEFQLQGSIYRWLNPDIITDDVIAINFLLVDFMPGRAANDPSYPKSSTPQKLISLMPVADTEAYIANKLSQLKRYQDVPEEDLPECSDKDLWRSDPEYKYYKNPEKRARSTKNFDAKQDAYSRMAADGGVGIVVEKPGQVLACKYCPAFPICTQKDELIADGSLQL